MSYLTISELASLQRIVSPVDISRWTGSDGTKNVYVREVSSDQFASCFEKSVPEKDRSAMMIAMSLCDSLGNPLVPKGDAAAIRTAVEQIRGFPFAMVDAMISECNRVNRIGLDADEPKPSVAKPEGDPKPEGDEKPADAKPDVAETALERAREEVAKN